MASASLASSSPTFFPESRWIWDDGDSHPRNAWLLFRRDFEIEEQELAGAILHVCADTRYEARLNGIRLGQGPVRSWPDRLYPDSYKLSGAGGPGVNRLEILVNHYGLGTCSSIEGAAGLIAEVVLDDGRGHVRRIGSDASWQVATHPGYVRTVPKMANGLSWAEVYRADRAAGQANWSWRAATEKEGEAYSQRSFLPRDIEYLTDEPVYPINVASWRRVRRRGFIRSVNLRWLVFPGEFDLNKHKVFRGFIGFSLVTVRALHAQMAIANDPHDSKPLGLNLNGRCVRIVNGRFEDLDLVHGRNWLLVNISGMFHDPEFHFVFDLPEGCRLKPLFDETIPFEEGRELCFLGPFGAISQAQAGTPLNLDLPVDPSFDRLLSAKGMEEVTPYADRAHPLGEDCVSFHHVALDSLYQATIEELPVPPRFLQVCRSAVDDQASMGIEVRTKGDDSELVLDFGRELSGFLEFEIEASAGATVDFFCYESQHDGIIEHTFSLNNSLRYICREGRQRYRSPVRRGFRFCKLTLRSGDRPVLLHSVRLDLAVYPVAATGRFRSSDYLLERIWELCRHNLRICMEDTFVDCPAYEQTLWTGDSYTSSLYSHYLFGCYEFPAHGNRLTARSLERSVLIESTIPSAWQNIIPNWSFLWVQSCVDHWLYSGDTELFEELFPSLMTTLGNTERFIPESGPLRGLFAIDAWNFIDWAPLDSPDSGAAVAHQNAMLVWTARRLAEAARKAGHLAEADRLDARTDRLGLAIDDAFWSEERQAYIDCVRDDGRRSASFSLHTQLFMFLAGCGSVDRRRKMESYLIDLPEGFIDIASPFVRLFHFKALLEMGERGQEERVFDAIRRIWGEMLQHDATTCWEGWSFIPGHYTRSHCHAWSSSPAYFIGAHMLGIRPLEPGFRRALVQPWFGGLTWMDGAVPTPHGPVQLRADARKGAWDILIEAPTQVKVLFRYPAGFFSSDCGDGAILQPTDRSSLSSSYRIHLNPI
jgi:hypothetical protein